MHPLPTAHFFAGAQMPPQSVSVSFWFFTVSLQVAATQALPVHTRLTQSLPAAQP